MVMTVATRTTPDGAHDRNRTCDLFLTKEVLYRLSYVSTKLTMQNQFVERETGIEPAPSAWKAEVLPLNYSRPCIDLHYAAEKAVLTVS